MTDLTSPDPLAKPLDIWLHLKYNGGQKRDSL